MTAEDGLSSAIRAQPNVDAVAAAVRSFIGSDPRVAAERDGFVRILANALGVPAALLLRQGKDWAFVAEGFPASGRQRGLPPNITFPLGGGEVVGADGEAWTGVVIGSADSTEWLLMLPGLSEDWVPLAMAMEDSLAPPDQAGIESSAADPEDYFERLAATVHALSRRLARTTDAAQVHALLLRAMVRQVSALVGAMAVPDDTGLLSIVATHGYPSALVEHVRIGRGEGILGRAVDEQRPFIGVAVKPRPRYRSASYIVVPLVAGGRALGVVALTDQASGRPFNDRDLRALRVLSGPAVLALATQQLHESYHDLAQTASVDAVTGLFNRRYFEERIRSEIQRARRQSQELALLMVDVDDFKRVNDTVGHLEGDRTLREVADLLKRGVRVFDVCARFGGEEFAIVMPGAGAAMAAQVAERIRKRVEERLRSEAVPVTISIGVALLGPHETPEQLIGAADRALMAAKQLGKNNVQVERWGEG